MDLLSNSSAKRQSRQTLRIGMAFAVIAISTIVFGLFQTSPSQAASQEDQPIEAAALTQLLTGTLKTQSGLSLGVGVGITAQNGDGSASTTTDADGNFSFNVPSGTVEVRLNCSSYLWRDSSSGDSTSVQLPGYPCTYGNVDAGVPWDSTQGLLALKLPDVRRVRVHVTSGGVAVAGASVSSGSRLRSTSFELSAASGARAAVNATIPYVPIYPDVAKLTDANGDVFINVWESASTFQLVASKVDHGVNLTVTTYGFSTTDSLATLELPPPPVELTGTLKTQSGLSLGVGVGITAENGNGRSSTRTDVDGNFSMWVPSGTVEVRLDCSSTLWNDNSTGDSTSVQLPGYPCTYGNVDAGVPWDSTQGLLALKLPDVQTILIHVTVEGVAVPGLRITSGSRLRSASFELSAASGTRAAVNATIPYVPIRDAKLTDANGDAAINVWATAGSTFEVTATGTFNNVQLNGSMSGVPADGQNHSIAFTVPGNISYTDRNASAPFLTDLTLLETVDQQSLQSIFTLGQPTKRAIFSMSDGDLTDGVSAQTAPSISYSPPFTQTSTYYKTPILSQYRTSLSLDATSTLSGATITTYGLNNLHAGKNFATVQVSDPTSGAARSYTVAVYVPPSPLEQETLTLTSNQTSPIGTLFTLSTSGGSGAGLISYQIQNDTTTGCAESNGLLTATTAGICYVTAKKAADSTYAEAMSVRRMYFFDLWEQAVLVLTSTEGVVGTPLALTTSGGSGDGAVIFQMISMGSPGTASDCVVENGKVSASSAGTCRVEISKAESGNYSSTMKIGTVIFTVAQTTTTTEPSTTTTQPSNTSTTTTQPSSTSTTTTQPSSTSTTSRTVPPPVESVVVDLPRAETPLVADNSLSAGGEVTVTFGGFAPFEFVQLIVASTPQVIASGYANAQGVVTLSGSIPADLASGNHTLAVYAPESGTGFNQPITVAGLVLPATGWSGAELLYGWAMLMILLGVIWHFIARRRTARA